MRSGRAGFTLVEAMVVVAIIAAMLAIATPGLLSGLPGMRVNGAARQVLSDLRLTRALAVEQGVVATMTFTNPGTYTVAQDQDGNGTAETIKTVVLGDSYANIVLGTTVAPAPTDIIGAVTFRTNGSANTGGGVYLMPGGDTGTDRNRRVRLVGATGNLKIQSYSGGTWQ